MALKTLLFFGLFLLAAGGGLFVPLWSILGYMAVYIIGPEGQWWFGPLRSLGLRYSLVLAAVSALGILLNFGKLRFGSHWFSGHEKAVLLFLGLLWVLRFIHPETEFYTVVDHPSFKMTKVFVFCFMVTHVVTEMRSLKAMFWVLVVSTFILGMEAYGMPRSSFLSGRLEGVGGADFAESNVMPSFVVGVLPIMGIFLLQSGWTNRLLALFAGVFAMNAIILTRSRGALVALAMGALSALWFAPREYRKIIIGCLVLAILGGLYLTDTGFKDRMEISSSRDEGQIESSVQGRLDTWRASLALLADHPFGCGPGNFKQTIGNYDARFVGRDAHSTVVRCWAELGVPGFLLFAWIVWGALRLNAKAVQRARALPDELREQVMLPAFALSVGLIATLTAGLFITILYVEFLWWWLLFPVCMHRVIDNLEEDMRLSQEQNKTVSGY